MTKDSSGRGLRKSENSLIWFGPLHNVLKELAEYRDNLRLNFFSVLIDDCMPGEAYVQKIYIMLDIFWKLQMKVMRRVKVVLEMMTGLDFSKNLTLKELGLNREEGNIYSPTPDNDMLEILQSLTIQPTDAILDFGCGKGSAMAAMVKFPFEFVGGVEISEELCNIARQNLAKLNVKNVKILCSDASAFTDLDRYSHFYFFNPFPDRILTNVINNIVASHHRQPRKITLIYYLPAFRGVIDQCTLFRETLKINTRFYETIIYEN